MMTLFSIFGARYRPVIKWSQDSWTHNIFRVYELIFGRRVGVRLEVSSYFNDNQVTYFAHNFEGACALVEQYIRAVFKVRLPFRIYIPMLVTPEGWPIPASPFLFSIAFDSATDQFLSSANPTTWSHTCTGSDLIFILGVKFASGDHLGGNPTYNSVSTTQLNKQKVGTAAGFEYLQYLIAPATGANTVSVSTGGNNMDAVSLSYTGANQSSFPDASNATNSGSSSTTQNISLTTISNNCWVGMITCCQAGSTLSAGTGTTIRGTFHNMAMFDNNAAKTPAGSVTLQTTTGVSDISFAIIYAIAPFVPPTTGGNFLAFM